MARILLIPFMNLRLIMLNYQQTIAKPIQINGVGLHSGKKVRMTLLPAAPSTGVYFVSTQNHQEIRVKASVHHITDTTLSTTLGIPDSAEIHTVEHILAALFGLGIDNLTILLDDIEIPIMDGSALPFIKIIPGAGIVKQNIKKKFLRILDKIEIEEDGKAISILPHAETKITYTIDFEHALIGLQHYSLTLTNNSFIREIAPARTFGFLSEFKNLQKQGLIKGGTLDNAVVIDQDKIINKEGLRFRDEFVRHKILDLVGDFSLLGHPIQGHIIAQRAGHTLHAKLMAKILQEKQSWELIEEPSNPDSPLQTDKHSEIALSSR
jgi:UDP-3-O-[3-hydroxymyristoyl] N-acetylglucosamine deacetylase